MNGHLKAERVNEPAVAAEWMTEVEVTHNDGLHARPSVTFTRLAKSFPCRIDVKVNENGGWINGKSIVAVMGARIRKGSRLEIRATGPGGEEAVSALRSLIEENFDEGRSDDGAA